MGADFYNANLGKFFNLQKSKNYEVDKYYETGCNWYLRIRDFLQYINICYVKNKKTYVLMVMWIIHRYPLRGRGCI